MLVKTTDGTPDAVKVACPVWSGGKSGDNLKGLPITIGRGPLLPGAYRLYLVRSAGGGKEFQHPAGNVERLGSAGGGRKFQECRGFDV